MSALRSTLISKENGHKAMRRPACFISTGSVLIDLPLHVERIPAPGGAVTATSAGPTVGGGYTVVSAVARQGLPAALAATLGTGPNSAQVRETMMHDGVELLVEELVGDIGTCTTLIEPSGRRTFITTEGVEAEPQLEDLQRLELQAGDWVYATGYDLVHRSSRDVLTSWLLDLPDGVGLVVDLGPVQPEIPDRVLLPILRRTTLLTGNHFETTQLTARLGSPEAMRRACPDGLLVRRTGVHGCVLWPADGDRIEVPGFARDVVDTTGAGDTHTGVLVVGLMDGLDVVAAARRANAAAAEAVSRIGPARAPRRDEIDAFLRE
ncbi:Sugar or nucleoside kinase, ribokinase family [Actinomyces ruminicola]|uniref:Sugar or nucleoside kinase, ribokinase family n=2 Tax=Actinomyces ruminicola TaxID=332524 RepID=A0A1G9ZHG6_9ACTO|nr:Sugar or nucleoside kinase, ribokinase family [Actinomyces ruminicola]